VTQIVEDEKTPMRLVYDPSHPDANKDGYVEFPNINPVTEMVDMISATRAYEANVNSIQAARSMGKAAMEI
jgi:flagellar basal-body rod protein FlgC